MQSRQYSVQRICRISASRVEYGPISHVVDPAEIEYPLTGDFRHGDHDALCDQMRVGDTHTFIPQAAEYDTHILDRFADLSMDLRTSVRVRRIR
jgi:hypothetical protein